MIGEDLFHLNVATPTNATSSVSLKASQKTSKTGSSFPPGAQQGLLTCWCQIGSSVYTGVQQGFPAGAKHGLLSPC